MHCLAEEPMAEAALLHRRLIEDGIRPDRAPARPEEKWPMRRTLIFIVGMSAVLWAGIIYTAWALF